jgi:hypothetical protein
MKKHNRVARQLGLLELVQVSCFYDRQGCRPRVARVLLSEEIITIIRKITAAMKSAIITFCICLLPFSQSYGRTGGDTLEMAVWLQQAAMEIHALQSKQYVAEEHLVAQLAQVNQILASHPTANKSEEYLWALQRKLQLRDEMTLHAEMYKLGMAKVRYRKGLEIIKIMYEKVLGLDHHLSSLKTYQNIAQLSNPNAYPEFRQTQDMIKERLKKNNAVQLPKLLHSNPLLSATFSLAASLIGDMEPGRKEKDLEKISCILDFTVQMYADLNLIYYETEFLKENNSNLKTSCTQLFRDYTKIIGYKVELDVCRAEDDWEAVYDKLDDFIAKLEKAATKSQDDPAANRELMKGIANLEFSLDRVLDFLEKYSSFIVQGEKYYRKFEVIASSYPNEASCIGQLPQQYSTLKQDIQFSIEKFREAYNIAELTGSKLKDLLYGTD